MNRQRQRLKLLNDIGLVHRSLVDAQHQWLATQAPGYSEETRAAMVESVAIILAERERLIMKATAMMIEDEAAEDAGTETDVPEETE